MTTRELRPVLLGIILCLAIIAVWWATTHDFAPTQLAADAALESSGSDTGEGLRSETAGVAPREVNAANENAAESETEDVDELMLEAPPDTPPAPPDIRPEFATLLMRAAEVNGTGTPSKPASRGVTCSRSRLQTKPATPNVPLHS